MKLNNFYLEINKLSESKLLNSESEELLMKNAYLDLITQELANRGTPQSETQLKYNNR